MSKKHKIIITAIIIVFSLFLIPHNFLYSFSYKNKAKRYVENHFKTKYNSDVKIKK